MFWIIGGIITLVLNLSRSQTFLPLFFLFSGGILGLFDDYINIKSSKHGIKGIRAPNKLFWQLLIAGFGAWWFYVKLGFDVIHIPAIGDFTIGWWYIPIFILIIVTTANAVNITDGLDGLSCGLLFIALVAFMVISSASLDLPLIIFLALLVGALLAFLYFNVYPARIWLGDVGSLSFGATLAVVGLLLGKVMALVVIGGFFVLEPEIFNYIEGDNTFWERDPLENLAKDEQLVAYRHSGFWKCMDTLTTHNCI